jgi:hypothetical protein
MKCVRQLSVAKYIDKYVVPEIDYLSLYKVIMCVLISIDLFYSIIDMYIVNSQ